MKLKRHMLHWKSQCTSVLKLLNRCYHAAQIVRIFVVSLTIVCLECCLLLLLSFTHSRSLKKESEQYMLVCIRIRRKKYAFTRSHSRSRKPNTHRNEKEWRKKWMNEIEWEKKPKPLNEKNREFNRKQRKKRIHSLFVVDFSAYCKLNST